MSDKLRKRIGLILLPTAILMLLAGLLPLRTPSGANYTGTARNPALPEQLILLSEQDGFNTGNTETLSAYPGIGKATAAAILADRKENGRFWFPEDILAVKGIGEKKLEQIRPLMITVTEEREE
jgi:competence ComEA-like helix-hairpin-helix protein